MEVLFSPIEYESYPRQRVEASVCVVFDVLRATSSMVTALYNGARSIRATREISDAVRAKQLDASCLLAGERNGQRIRAEAAGGMEFDFGNSPREFSVEAVKGRNIVMTTTNGTRALQACERSRASLICSFLNLRATANYLLDLEPVPYLLVCSGTGEHVAYEDVLCAGALVGLLAADRSEPMADSALIASRLFEIEQIDLKAGLGRSTNGQRLLAMGDLRDDVEFCAQRDRFPIVAGAKGAAPIAVIQR